MRYFKDDVVELLSLTEYQDQWYTVGFKYRVKTGSYGSDPQINVYNPKTSSYYIMSHNQIMLYHRPLKNWIKYFLKIIRI